LEAKLQISKTLTTGILGWLAIGAISLLYTTIYAWQPPTSILGVAGSPGRIVYWYQYVLLIEVPLSVLFIYWFTREEWHRSPPGSYVPGKHYAIFNTYNLSAMGTIAALYAVLGLVTVSNVDVVAMVTAFAAAFFGPLIAFVGVFIGAFIRFGIGGLSNIVTNPASLPAFAFSDASRWAIGGFIIWRLVRVQRENAMGLITWVAVLPLIILVHAGSIIFSFFALNPLGPFLGNLGFMGFWYPTSLISIIIGLAVAEGAYRAATRNMRAMAPKAP
jgi:hypothetical protein